MSAGIRNNTALVRRHDRESERGKRDHSADLRLMNNAKERAGGSAAGSSRPRPHPQRQCVSSSLEGVQAEAPGGDNRDGRGQSPPPLGPV